MVLSIACLFAAVLILLFGGLLEWSLDGFLHYETPLQKVDTILVSRIGANLDKTIELYKEGFTRTILITVAVPDKYDPANKPLTMHDLIRQTLLDADVDPQDIFCLPKQPRNMLERQIMIRDFIREHKMTSYMMYSGNYSSRMQKMLHDDTFPEGCVRLVLYPAKGKILWRKHWLGIQNTLVRMVYWKVVYQGEMQTQVEAKPILDHHSESMG